MASDRTLDLQAAADRESALIVERDEAIRERDVMRKANITPEDAARPLGQSVEYWQDRALDFATHGDRKYAEAMAARADRDALLEAIEAERDLAIAASQGAAVDPVEHERVRVALYDTAHRIRGRT